MKKNFITLLLALALFGCGGSNTNKNNSLSDVQKEADQLGLVEQETSAKVVPPVFVLSDQYGEKFLLLASFEGNVAPEVPAKLSQYKYIIYDERFYPVKFNGCQLENEEENNYRDMYYNFDNLSGWLYEMQSGKLLENPEDEYDAIEGAALLVDENYKKTATILGLKNREGNYIKMEDVSETVQKAFEQKYGRKLHLCFASAIFGEKSEYQLVNAQFETEGTKALGVTALVENGEIKAVKEFPAEYDAYSTWRVDDEGEFGGLVAVLVVMENGVLTLYTVNGGEEGCNYENYVVKGDSLCEGNVSESFYQAPM